MPNFDPRQVLPPGLALYAKPHLPLDDTWRVEEGDATDDDERVDVEKDERVALGLDSALLDRTATEDDDAEQVPNFELQPVPQYALELPQYEY